MKIDVKGEGVVYRVSRPIETRIKIDTHDPYCEVCVEESSEGVSITLSDVENPWRSDVVTIAGSYKVLRTMQSKYILEVELDDA